MSAGAVCWRAPPANPPQARDLPPPTPAPKKLVAVVVPDSDPVEAWRKSLAATGGGAVAAKEALICTEPGAKLYMLANRVLAERNAYANPSPGAVRRIPVL
jgi:hypothetical protein